MQEKKPYDRSGSTRKNIRFPDDLLKKIDKKRGKQPFSEWVIGACKDKL